MSTITAIMEPDADGTLHLPLPAAWRHGRVKVVAQVELLPEEVQATTSVASGGKILEIMERIARKNPFQSIQDPAAWQREMREDVILPWQEQG